MSVRRAGPSSMWIALFAAVSAASPLALAQQPGVPESVLPGRPDAAVAATLTPDPTNTGEADAAADPLDPAFTSETAGIAFRPPSGGTMVRRAAGSGDEIVRFVNDQKKWRLVVSRISLSEPLPLTIMPDAAAPNGAAPQIVNAGFAETVAQQMPNETPGKLVRSELLPINGYDGAFLASRFRDATGTPSLMQQAIVRRTDKQYYVVSYTTALSKETGELQADPLAQRAVATFEAITESIQLIDQEQIANDQAERLIRTRSLFVNWTRQRISDAIVGEQWLRLIKDGKDIGYTYVVEELANDVPRAGNARGETVDPAKATGVRVGVRSRTTPEPGVQIDADSWMWVSFDRGQEQFRNTLASTTDPALAKGAPQPATGVNPEPIVDYSVEGGTSVRQERIVPRVVPKAGGLGNEVIGERSDQYELQILFTGKRQALPMLKQPLPPYYLPQALGHLLPRLLPLTSPKTYLFASYISDRRQVMLRYVDVLPSTNVALAGVTHTAVPVQERIGLEGSITTHYVTPAGKYLGSVNEDNKITIVATDEATLLRIWKDAKIERPGDVSEDAATPSAPASPAIVPATPGR